MGYHPGTTAFLSFRQTAWFPSLRTQSAMVFCRNSLPACRWSSVYVVVLLFLCPLSAQHNDNALLRSRGVVKVNGAPATSSTVVVEGDRIDDGNVVPSPSVAKLSSASAMAHDSDPEGQGDRNAKGKQTCLSASGNKKCVCHKKTNNVDVCEIED
jgi:hypothetical protein